MAVTTSTNCKFFIGTTTAAEDIAGYEADTFTEVGEVEDMGEFPDAFNEVAFASLNDGAQRRYKGIRDYGSTDLVVGFDSNDAGQTAMKEALEDTSQAIYNVKLQLNDQLTDAGSPTTLYFGARVASRNLQVGASDNIIRATVQVWRQTPFVSTVAS